MLPRVLALVAVAAALSAPRAAAAPLRLTCPSYEELATPYAAHLDASRYEGFWYEVASQNLPFLSSCKCSVYNFTCTSNGCASFDDHFTCNKDVSKPGSDYDLVLKVTNG